MVTLSVELRDEVAEHLRRLAGEEQSIPEHLLAQAAEAILADRKALIRSIERGRADAAAGRVRDHEDVMGELDVRTRELETRHRAGT
jgi:predicted transcriptional regulator